MSNRAAAALVHCVCGLPVMKRCMTCTVTGPCRHHCCSGVRFARSFQPEDLCLFNFTVDCREIRHMRRLRWLTAFKLRGRGMTDRHACPPTASDSAANLCRGHFSTPERDDPGGQLCHRSTDATPVVPALKQPVPHQAEDRALTQCCQCHAEHSGIQCAEEHRGLQHQATGQPDSSESAPS